MQNDFESEDDLISWFRARIAPHLTKNSPVNVQNVQTDDKTKKNKIEQQELNKEKK